VEVGAMRAHPRGIPAGETGGVWVGRDSGAGMIHRLRTGKTSTARDESGGGGRCNDFGCRQKSRRRVGI